MEKMYKKDQVHAVFIYNLTRFVRWPATAFKTPDSPHNICVLGKTPVAEILSQVVRDESVNGRYFEVKRVDNIKQSFDCHILFFTEVTARLHNEDIHLLKEKPILLISPQSNFATDQGMMALGQKGNRVQPIINIGNVNSANIRISSKLLRLATIVGMN